MNYLDFVKNLADREYFGQKLGLERVQLFLQHLGNPHQSYPSIHIAGTNGKGSTAAMLASVLKEAGYRVGLYTSPHLEDFCERIQISGEMISQNSLMQLVEKFQVIEKKIGIELTFFEFTTALAFQYFADQKIDIAVIEVGLGGRLDATNVMTPLVSVITSIGLDHQKFLGDTLEKIAFEKAGIIKPGVPVVIGELPREGEQVIRRVAEEKKSWVVHGHGEQSRTMNVAQFDGSTSSPCPSSEMNKLHAKLGLIGEHQKINASMVLDVVRLLNQSGKFKICFPDIEKGLASVNWPGRLETISKKPWILLDGAHNVEAMQKVVDYVSVEKKGRKLFCLFGMMKDKKSEDVLKILSPSVDEFVFSQIEGSRAFSAQELEASLKRISSSPRDVSCDTHLSLALEKLVKRLKAEDVLLITGSFYIIGEARTWLKKYYSH